MALMSSNFVNNNEEMDDNLKPVPDQFGLKPGDHAMAFTSTAMIDDHLTVIRILDPSAASEAPADWEQRLQRSYIFGEWRSSHSKEPNHGWFARVRLLPITETQHNEVIELINANTKPGADLPDWVSEKFYEISTVLSANAPDRVPRAVVCEMCGGHNVDIHISSLRSYSNRAGQLEPPPDTESDREFYYVYLNTGSEDRSQEGHLHCNDCQAKADLDDDTVNGLIHMRKHLHQL